MFGYVTINKEELSPEAVQRYAAFYCGLCRTLNERHGNLGRVTLSYDMTLLYVLLTSLYEPEETAGEGRCPPHPLKTRPYVQNEITAYVADMNIALFYHKCLDNWQDERKLSGWATAGLLTRAYRRVQRLYPEKCRVIEDCLREITALEHAEGNHTDALANLTGRMLGELYTYKPDDLWAGTLRAMGTALGRFIYVMDAYDDLPEDRKKKRFNPLVAYAEQEDYEALFRESLSMLMAECADAFEFLPLVNDMDILRNILYSGVWSRYAAIQKAQSTEEETA